MTTFHVFDSFNCPPPTPPSQEEESQRKQNQEQDHRRVANQMAELRQAKQDLEQEVDTQKKRLRLHIEAQVRAAVILECPGGSISGQSQCFYPKPFNI